MCSKGPKHMTVETNAKSPNTPRAQAPMDIGSQNLSARSMLRKRDGTPRSAISSRPQSATRGSDNRYPTSATRDDRGPPMLSAIAAVKWAPPAMPPKKKYRTIIIPHSGVLSMPTSVPPPAIAEREERTEPDEDGRADREQRVDYDVALRDLRILREVVCGRLRQEEEERVQATQEALLIRPVELG